MDEGVQFVLEDNLLNFLMLQSDKAPFINSLWLTNTSKTFYERALSAPYVPPYVSYAVTELTQIFTKMHKPSVSFSPQQLSSARSMRTESESFVPNALPNIAVKEMSPGRIP